jgi:gas vesicle protein
MNNQRIYYSHDAEMHAMQDRTLLAILFLTCGLGIGAALTLLLAPTSGKSVRDDLGKTMGQGWNNGRDAFEPVVSRLEEEFADLRKSVEERLKQSS